MTANIPYEQKAALSYAIAAKKAKLHAVIQAPAMLFSALEAVVRELQPSNLGQRPTIIVVPGRRVADCSKLCASPVAWGHNPYGQVSDTIILYVERYASVDAYSYIKHEILPRLTVGGSLIVLADTTPYADLVSDTVADLLPQAVRVRLGCGDRTADSLFRLMAHMGPEEFNRHYGIRSDVRLAAQPTAAINEPVSVPSSEPVAQADLRKQLLQDHLIAALGFEPTLKYMRETYGPHWDSCSANKHVGLAAFLHDLEGNCC